MLFDVRSPGRRRTTRVMFFGIAIIFLLGFVGLGVGAGLGGNLNLGEALSGGSGSGRSYSSEVAKAEKRTRREPASAAAWAALVEAQLFQAAESTYSNQSLGGYTTAGKKLLPKIQHSWERYLALQSKNPSASLAHRMLGPLSEEGLDDAAGEVQALQIVFAAEPPAGESAFAEYVTLAQYAYQAKDTEVAKLASDKALSLAPQSEKATLRGELSTLKKDSGHLNSTSTSALSTTGG
jgi:hypothetical protein